ncbi:hypothetical protein [Garciella nitratireducens]
MDRLFRQSGLMRDKWTRVWQYLWNDNHRKSNRKCY